MWLRMVRAQGMIGREVLATAVRYQEDELPAIVARPGCIATGMGVNPDRGGALSLTFWEDEQLMVAGKAAGDEARDRLAREFGRPNPYRVHDLEVLFVTGMLAVEGSLVTQYIHLSLFEGLSADGMERMLEIGMRDTRLDAEARGCEGVVVAADRASGRLAAIGFWESQRDMRAVRRLYDGAVPGITDPTMDSFELVVAHDLDALPQVEKSPA